MSDRIETITMTVKIPTEDYAEVMPELLAGIERAAQNLLIEYTTPEVTRLPEGYQRQVHRSCGDPYCNDLDHLEVRES